MLERVMNATLFNAGGVDVIAYVLVVPSLWLVTVLAATALGDPTPYATP